MDEESEDGGMEYGDMEDADREGEAAGDENMNGADTEGDSPDIMRMETFTGLTWDEELGQN